MVADASACLPCKLCDINATTTGACSGSGSSDLVSCTCNKGYTGNGVSCSACYGPTASWLTNFCQGVDQGKVTAAIQSNTAITDWCTLPNVKSPCESSFSTSKATFFAGNASYSLQVAGSPFVPAAISASQSKEIMSAAFKRFRASNADSCTATDKGVSCRDQVALLAVPGLLVKSTRGQFHICVHEITRPICVRSDAHDPPLPLPSPDCERVTVTVFFLPFSTLLTLTSTTCRSRVPSRLRAGSQHHVSTRLRRQHQQPVHFSGG